MKPKTKKEIIEAIRKLAGSVKIPQRFKGLSLSKIREKAIREYFSSEKL